MEGLRKLRLHKIMKDALKRTLVRGRLLALRLIASIQAWHGSIPPRTLSMVRCTLWAWLAAMLLCELGFMHFALAVMGRGPLAWEDSLFLAAGTHVSVVLPCLLAVTLAGVVGVFELGPRVRRWWDAPSKPSRKRLAALDGVDF